MSGEIEKNLIGQGEAKGKEMEEILWGLAERPASEWREGRWERWATKERIRMSNLLSETPASRRQVSHNGVHGRESLGFPFPGCA